MQAIPGTKFLSLAATAAIVWFSNGSAGAFAAPASAVPVVIQIGPPTATAPIPQDFLGFGYEASAIAQPDFFSVNNARMVQLYRNLTPHGLVRIGGNVSDHTKYIPDGIPSPRAQSEVTIINRANLVDFGDFLRATGWRAMWGLNLATGTKEEAAQEAVAVQAALGPQLQSFEIGNEVDLQTGFRGNYAAYHAAYLDFKAAIRAVLPQAVFSGPDVARPVSWCPEFAEAEGADMQLVTQHYYRAGAQQPAATLETLLGRDPAWESTLETLARLGQAKGLSYRINETNSFYGGGKAGVSDSFGAALWCLDFLFVSASRSCAGVNMETDVNHLGWISYYSPLGRDAKGEVCARPEYYGMLAFAQAGHGRLLQVQLDAAGKNVTAYATQQPGAGLWVTVINKDFSRAAVVTVKLPEAYAVAQAIRLSAPSLQSKDQVTLAGKEVSASGQWSGQAPEQFALANGACNLLVPQASAVLLHFAN